MNMRFGIKTHKLIFIVGTWWKKQIQPVGRIVLSPEVFQKGDQGREEQKSKQTERFRMDGLKLRNLVGL